jgi:Tfp pilus tip-associated adhesin PilY1
VHVIVIGSDVGEDDGNPTPGYFSFNPPNDVMCNDSAAVQGCYADNVAHYAYNSFGAPLAGTGSVKSHGIFIDSASTTASDAVTASTLYASIAELGQGLYFAPIQPGNIAMSIWQILTASFSGTYSDAAVTMSPTGDKLFATYYEVEGGYPLYKGHLLAWNVDNNPSSTTYGAILAGSGPLGEIWDAGQKLYSRELDPGSTTNVSMTSISPNQDRFGLVASSAESFYSAGLAFDFNSLGSGTDLTQLLVEEVPLSANEACAPLPHDYNFDCQVDYLDAQLLVRFIRGDTVGSGSPGDGIDFWSTAVPRQAAKLGDTGHSYAVAAPNEISAIATENHFQAYRRRVRSVPGMVYVQSNAGMLHAFFLDDLTTADHEGQESWFWVPRAKANWNATAADTREFAGNQIHNLYTSGQTAVAQGSIRLGHVFLDGWQNGFGSLPATATDAALGACGEGYTASMADGVIDANGCEWHRVLVMSTDYGGRTVWALDVTRPDAPRFLWERNDTDGNTGPGRGRSLGAPGLSSFIDFSTSGGSRRWITVWASGSQSPGVSALSGPSQYTHAAVYIHDMVSDTSLTPTDYPEQGFSIDHPALASLDTDSFDEYLPPEHGLFGTPAVVDFDGDGSADAAYVGDSMGYMFKVLFNQNTPLTPTRCLFSAPDATDEVKHLYYEPAVFFSQAGEALVYYGSGSPFNIYDAIEGGIYVKKDPTPFACSLATAAPCATSSTLFNSSGFMAFTGVGEKLVGAPTVMFGRMFFSTHVPGSNPCVLGNSRLYGLNVETCGGGIFDDPADSYTVTSNLYTEMPGLISQPVFANGQVYALNLDGSLDANDIIDDFQVTPNNATDFVYSSWRHVF